jgi:DNA-binding transcriptional ArsR family regulator
MGYQTTLEILGDPTRQQLVERLRAGPLPVGRLAAGLPVSRPAVSKHLRVMKDAGLVRMTEEGTRNLYELDLQTLDELRRYLEGLWDTSLKRLKKSAESSFKQRKRQAGRARSATGRRSSDERRSR